MLQTWKKEFFQRVSECCTKASIIHTFGHGNILFLGFRLEFVELLGRFPQQFFIKAVLYVRVEENVSGMDLRTWSVLEIGSD